MADCDKPVGAGVVNFPCNLQRDHEGPCVAAEKPETARKRQRWLNEQRLSKKVGVPVTIEEEVDADFDEIVDAIAKTNGGEVMHDEPTRTREGDQPLPVINDRPFVQDAVIADIEARKQVGIERYGTPLQPFNHRSAMQDLYEELLDGACYIKQAIIEWDELERQRLAGL